jgi:translation initiation factor 1 (eIF-1/SUI1)
VCCSEKYYSQKDALQYLWAYVKDKNLSAADSSAVELDQALLHGLNTNKPTMSKKDLAEAYGLAHCILSTLPLQWHLSLLLTNQLLLLTTTAVTATTRFKQKMQNYYSVIIDGKAVIRKGLVPSITITAEQRGGHKCITKISGIDAFGLDATLLAQQFRTIFAASTTINSQPTKGSQSENVCAVELAQKMQSLANVACRITAGGNYPRQRDEASSGALGHTLQGTSKVHCHCQ